MENRGQTGGDRFAWDKDSAYLRRPPFADDTTPVTDIESARVLLMLGDSTTTDHISPAGAIPVDSAAGRYLADRGVRRFDFNTQASRSGNREVMVRGTFANVQLTQVVPGVEGSHTLSFAEGGQVRTIYEAAMAYRDADVPWSYPEARSTAPGRRVTGPRKDPRCWACGPR